MPPTAPRSWLAVAAILVFFPGCDRNTAPFEAGHEPSTPDLSRIFPESGEAPAAAPNEAAPTAAAAIPGGSAGNSIRGSIDLASGGSAPAGATLFVIARPAGARGGPPLAVRRFVAPSFPIDFEIGPEHVMIPSLRFEGEIQLTARLDVDGNAMTRAPGDLEGAASGPAAPGAEGITILIR